MKTFVLIVTFAATTDLIGGARTERIANFDDYQACVSAGRALYSQQHWECVPENQHPKEAPARGFRQFLLRGVKKVRAEWAMICTTHNLLKLFTLAKAA
jgi:hypothetical protein